MTPGLYGDASTGKVYYVNGTTARWIETQQLLWAEFGGDAYDRVTWFADDSFTRSLSGGGASSIGGGLLVAVAVVLVLLVLLLRRGR